MTEPSRTRYQPPTHLITSSGLSASKLILQFEAFQSCLPMAAVAPELIFERALSNLLSASPLKEHSETAQLALRVQSLEQRLAAITNANNTVSESETCLPTNPVRFTFVSEPDRVGVRADLYSGGDLLSGIDCQWPNPSPKNSDNVQFGCYNTAEDSSLERPLGSCTSIDIDFADSFTEVPIVAAWFTGVDVLGLGLSRVELEVGRVSKSGFDLDLRSYVDSTICNASVAWVAFLSAKEDFATSGFRVEVLGSRGHNAAHPNLEGAQRKLLFLGVQSIFLVGRVRMPVVIKSAVKQKDFLYWSLGGGDMGSGYCVLEVVAIAQVDRNHTNSS